MMSYSQRDNRKSSSGRTAFSIFKTILCLPLNILKVFISVFLWIILWQGLIGLITGTPVLQQTPYYRQFITKQGGNITTHTESFTPFKFFPSKKTNKR